MNTSMFSMRHLFLQGQPWYFTKTNEDKPEAICQNDNFPRNECGQCVCNVYILMALSFSKDLVYLKLVT